MRDARWYKQQLARFNGHLTPGQLERTGTAGDDADLGVGMWLLLVDTVGLVVCDNQTAVRKQVDKVGRVGL